MTGADQARQARVQCAGYPELGRITSEVLQIEYLQMSVDNSLSFALLIFPGGYAASSSVEWLYELGQSAWTWWPGFANLGCGPSLGSDRWQMCCELLVRGRRSCHMAYQTGRCLPACRWHALAAALTAALYVPMAGFAALPSALPGDLIVTLYMLGLY